MADKTYDMDAYRQSSAYQSLGIDKLQEQLSGYQKDDTALREQAEAMYKPTYDANLEALKQQTAQQVQGYQSQLAGLGTSYDQQRRETNESYDQGAVNLANALTRRGLGRSSLVTTQGAYLEKQRGQALSDINASQTAAANAINEKIALLTDQAAQSERTMAGSYASQIEARINELRQQNQSAATNLQLQIAALQQQGYQAWLAERAQQLEEEKFAYQKKKSSSSSFSSGSNNPYVPPVNNPSNDSDSLLDELMGPPQTMPGLGGSLVDATKNILATAKDRMGELNSKKTGTAKLPTPAKKTTSALSNLRSKMAAK